MLTCDNRFIWQILIFILFFAIIKDNKPIIFFTKNYFYSPRFRVKEYYENGKLKSATTYKNGVPGETKNYDENGKLTQEQAYDALY